jgi:deoxyribodipyrimidine photo-lyase
VAAEATGRPVVPVFFFLDDETPARWRPGGAGRWWLDHSLACLAQGLGSVAGRREDDFALVPRRAIRSGCCGM